MFGQSFGYLFAVVEVRADAGDYLICLMSFAGDKYDVSFPGKSHGCAYGFAAVCYGDGATTGFFVEAGKHVGDDVFGFLIARVVGCEYYTVTPPGRFGGHDGAFATVTVAAGATDGDDRVCAADDVAYGVKNVNEGIGRVGIVDYSRDTAASECLKTPGNRHEAAHGDKKFITVKAHKHSGAIDGREVGGVESACKKSLDFITVKGDEHAVEAGLY